MHADTRDNNPYESPRDELPGARRTARWWKYHCPECDAVCVGFLKSQSGQFDAKSPFPCPTCGTMLQFRHDSAGQSRAVIFCALMESAIVVPLWLLWARGTLGLGVALPITVAVSIAAACVIPYSTFKSRRVVKAADPHAPA